MLLNFLKESYTFSIRKLQTVMNITAVLCILNYVEPTVLEYDNSVISQIYSIELKFSFFLLFFIGTISCEKNVSLSNKFTK